ncbi:MAG: hypothetical protein A3H98_08860 [Bacteroidetes bacterium RIFCSPLOWO2_02_FULL_36_8]|nr:MAG: hypothetical protein A3H98_08860 [Bacteroidetes bacterium RIFCSPLOWO2_02_FULL_36_8]OFY69078.1 MAG: hypothetical protein A3G23_05860 [Bacteroidetes bacterium RIFCSPLOWO2_12_FULL_37_12]
MPLSLIVAVSENNVIGFKNQLPWHLPDDMKYFKEKTLGHHVIMGRRSYQSIMELFGKPLSKRINIILTHTKNFLAPDCIVVNSPEEALANLEHDNEPFVIGGEKVYKEMMHLVTKIYLTRIHATVIGDAFFPAVDLSKWKETGNRYHPADEKHNYSFTFFEYENRNKND